MKSIDLQRIVVLLACICGAVGCFLPWFGPRKFLDEIGLGGFAKEIKIGIPELISYGNYLDSGKVALLLFLPGIFLPLSGDRAKMLQGGIFQLATWPPICGGAICIYHLMRLFVPRIVGRPMFGDDDYYLLLSPGIGLYMGAVVCIVLLVWEQAYRYVYSVQKDRQ